MTLEDQDQAKSDFINNMVNKYNYLDYKNFCLENGFEVMPFHVYALLIEPLNNPDKPVFPTATIDVRSSCCGGGKVL